jgi:tRNA threonylcarbamoyl adenosine modification protein YeaZ
MTHDSRRRAILALDTATTRVVVALGTPQGTIEGLSSWDAGYRHGETLLPAIARLLAENDLERSQVVGVVVGTGPGAFTGLRVGIATAKGLAHGLSIPLVGVSTGEALLAAAAVDQPVLLLPAGPSDRIVVREGQAAQLLPGGTDPVLAAGEVLVAVDLDDRAPDDAVTRGRAARDGLASALVRLGTARLQDGVDDGATPDAAARVDALARLVPDYVTLPRGARPASGTVTWSRDPR